ncbi:iron-sulfur cluster biosynthesis family protein [Companilactobacillus halodurans]|uniref:Iron-sulfur cluster biosynthesis family protein n=1 Tax=Companilactobacillus halodurans TaxID=2584183 RepID=A0A5P0ZMQ8_9LACO|nr:iron-sulfur cluster biosynthesis family protein [Companilactobacillus halodurans]MQS75399.1 iron-sulfur cluster biosynthesis family protein [Companilactobacillus halodurans]MQS97345.1 iron-sulfur cluster biosynthesis family protein [Companilactobacillus halodurans]
MEIKVSEQAKDKLQKYVDAGKKLLLDLDDGFGRFSNEGDCALITKFRVIAVDSNEDLSDYSVQLDSSLGKIYFKDSAKDFLDDGLTLKVDPKTQLLVFSNAKELIDKSVNIIDYDQVKA